MSRPRVVLLCGGLGGARLAPYLAEKADLTVIAGVGDDHDVHAVRVCPDLDAVMYSLAGIFHHERGYGLLDDTCGFAGLASSSGLPTWFTLGDRDLLTSLARSALLAEGIGLAEVTDRLRRAFGVSVRILPATEDRVRTRIRTAGRELAFQEYFVRDHAAAPIEAVRFDGIETARPAPGVLEAIATADIVVVGESSPVASILPILRLPGIHEALRTSAAVRIALSPVIRAVLPHDAVDAHHAQARAAFMQAVGLPHEPAAVASLYGDDIDVFVIDERDRALAPSGPTWLEADLLDRDPERRRALVGMILAVDRSREAADVRLEAATPARGFR